MRTPVVLMLDSRGIIIDSSVDVIIRHEMYSKALARKSKFKLVVFTSSRSIHKITQKYENLEIKIISNPTFNSFKFAKASCKFVKNNLYDVKIIIVGDPWALLVSALWLNKFLGGGIPIQTQIHSDIGDDKWRKLYIKNMPKYLLAKIFIRYADSVRAVGVAQSYLMTKRFNINKSRIEVIPVPINNLRIFPQSLGKRPRVIGFFGRIHQDRGVWEFLELIKKLNMHTLDFKIVIVGDGPDKQKFLSQLYKILPKSRITFLGHIPEKEMRKIWRRVGVLVSLAPVESYGRVMREALVAGVPVWARSSSGVKDLMDKCEKGTVKIIDLNKSASELSKDFEVLLKTKVGPKFAKAFIKENDTYAEKLAQSWIKTINKSKKV